MTTRGDGNGNGKGQGRRPPDTAELSRRRLHEPSLWLGLREELRLSPRELDVAIRLVLGDSLSEIAARLGIKKGTVVTYCRRIKRKAGEQDHRRLAVALLMASGLLLGKDK